LSNRATTALGTSLAVLGVILAFLAGMYLMHPVSAGASTVTDTRFGDATATSTIFVSSTGTVNVVSTVNKTDTIVTTVTDAPTTTTTGCSQSVSLPSGSYTNTENVHLLISACDKSVILVGPSYNPDEYTITCNNSCSVILENMAVNTYYVSVSLNGTVYTGQFVVTPS
jgi:hypothetical protein